MSNVPFPQLLLAHWYRHSKVAKDALWSDVESCPELLAPLVNE